MIRGKRKGRERWMEWRILRVGETGSTNRDAAEAGKRGETAGLVIVAERQTGGMGRLGRSWYSPPGGLGLYCSALLRPEISPEQAGLLSFCAANAMAEAVREYGFDAGIKWPNDILCGGRKICGILSACGAGEGGLQYAVIGSGLNLRKGSYPEELRERAACLEEFGAPPEREAILERYLERLEKEVAELEREGFAGIRKRYEALCVLPGRRVRVSGGTETEGTVTGIGEAGELLLETEEGKKEILAGDVSVRGMNGYV